MTVPPSNSGHGRCAALARWAVALVLAGAAPAWAVIPGLAGPIQALTQALPQILPVLLAAVAGALGVPAWRARFAAAGRFMLTRTGVAILLAAGLLLCLAPVLFPRGGRTQLAVGAAPPSPSPGDSWPMFRRDGLRSGSDGHAGPENPRLIWSFSDPSVRVMDIASSPSVVAGRVYFAGAQASVFDTGGLVYALNAATGKRLWRVETEMQGFSSPAVDRGRVYVGEGLHTDAGCRLLCLDAATGRKLWSVRTGSHTESSPAIAAGRIYFGAGDDGAYAADAASGKVLWHSPGMHIDVSPLVAAGRAYFGTGYGRLRALALDTRTGKPVWSTPCDLPVWGPPALKDGRVIYGIGNGDFGSSSPSPRGGIWSLDAATGRQAWRTELPDAVLSAISVQGGLAIAGCRDGNVYALDLATGRRRWTAPIGGPIVASPAGDGRRVYIAAAGALTALDAATGRRVAAVDIRPLTAPDVELYSSPALVGGRVYLGTSEGRLLCFGK